MSFGQTLKTNTVTEITGQLTHFETTDKLQGKRRACCHLKPERKSSFCSGKLHGYVETNSFTQNKFQLSATVQNISNRAAEREFDILKNFEL